MDRIEQQIVLECLREVSGNRALQLGDFDEVVARLISVDSDIQAKSAKQCLEGRPVARLHREKIAEAALTVLKAHAPRVLRHYSREGNQRTLTNIRQLLSSGARAVDVVFRNWANETDGMTHREFKTGIYQTFRRYKPTRDQSSTSVAGSGIDWSHDTNHVVICELVYLDYENMECVLVTSELNVYFGALFINYENQLFGVLQRVNGRNGGIHQRFLATRLEEAELPIASGVFMKTGDTTRRPLAAEFFYVRIPERHGDLYAAMAEIYEGFKLNPVKAMKNPVDAKSVLCEYITDNPPITSYRPDDPKWHRVKFVRDFPALAIRVAPDEDGIKVFREPSRSVGMEQLVKMSRSNPPLEVFRHWK